MDILEKEAGARWSWSLVPGIKDKRRHPRAVQGRFRLDVGKMPHGKGSMAEVCQCAFISNLPFKNVPTFPPWRCLHSFILA